MANPYVDAVVTGQDVTGTIQEFRNIVFHVADPALDPHEIDLTASAST